MDVGALLEKAKRVCFSLFDSFFARNDEALRVETPRITQGEES
jgi:hypothetical protein